MGRAPCCEKVGLKRGRWTAEEDDILTKYIQANGEGKWRSLPKNAGLLRCGKSCRLRWVNYLKSDLKKGNFSTEEDETIIKLHSSLGNRWCLIASHLPGRTDNEIKNYWNSQLRRKLYSYRKIIQELQQEVVVEQPLKLGSTNLAPQPRVSRTSRSATKKNKSKFPTKLPDKAPKKLVERCRKVTTSSQQVDNGAGTGLMPATLALEENAMTSMLLETIDDFFLDSDCSNMVFDDSEVGPTEFINLHTSSQLGDKNGEIPLTSDEVENWLMGDNITVQSKSELTVMCNSENGATPSIYANDKLDTLGWYWDNMNLNHESDTDKRNAMVVNNANPNFCRNDELETLGWDCGSLNLDGELQGEKLWDSGEQKLLSWLWDSNSDKGDDFDWISAQLQRESDSDI